MDNCVCCPLGKVVDILKISRQEKKQKEKLVGLSVEHLRWRRGKGGQRALLFLQHIKELSCSIRQMIGIYRESPDYKF